MVRILCEDQYNPNNIIKKDLVGAGPNIYVNEQSNEIMISVTAIHGEFILNNSINPNSLSAGPEGSILTCVNGNVTWALPENIFGELLKNQTIRDRVRNVINALDELDMTIKLCKD